MRTIYFALLLFLSLLLSGCAQKATSELTYFNELLNNNKCDFSLPDEKFEDNDDVILWGIQAGSLARNCGDFKKSIEYFDEAELHYKTDVDLKNPLLDLRDKSRSVLLNNAANQYEGNVYEKTLVNTYKALDFLTLGDKANARVEFNRALERQRIAAEYFASDIAKLQAQSKERLSELQNAQELYNSIADLSELQNRKNRRTAPDINFNQNAIKLAQERVQSVQGVLYPDFINPFATYMSAIFFLNDKSFAKASDLLRENLKMDPKNPQLAKDFALAEKMADGFDANFKERVVWLIYENGMGAVKTEERIDLPLFLVSNNVIYAGLALPRLQTRQSSFGFLILQNSQKQNAKTELIADMDSIIAAEFEKRYFAVAVESIVSSALKTIAQKQLNDIDPLLGFIGAIFGRLTTEADLRSWSALPKYFMAASVPLLDGHISVIDENGVSLLDETLPNDKNAIIYIKSAHKGQLIVQKIYF